MKTRKVFETYKFFGLSKILLRQPRNALQKIVIFMEVLPAIMMLIQ